MKTMNEMAASRMMASMAARIISALPFGKGGALALALPPRPLSTTGLRW
jgi:hypothetical protein